ncbi:hypothetical protein KCM76_12415 [Zooshikella marina]|uniref:hypothetical protein n=1 Tax=Zooshikella ganghwensis TaxID=202772 RepID=UPI001BB06624|nr:hypothetical protein [Zooshikella ganghwensis]MBU2706789.1 hypothetical protein [Zooshikella ganghwensis]
MARSSHKRMHGHDLANRLAEYNIFQKWLYGTPEWLIAAELSILVGFAAETIDD